MKKSIFHTLPWVYSLLIHTLLLSVFFYEVEFAVHDIEEINLPEKLEMIILNISDDLLDHGELQKVEDNVEALKISKVEAKPEINYEKLLTQHLSNVSKQIYNSKLRNFKTSILITLNNEGKILNYRFYPTIEDPETKVFFDKVLTLANPAPIPPKNYLKNNRVSFMIQLNN